MNKGSLSILEFLEEFARKYTRIAFRSDYSEMLRDLNVSQAECIYVLDFALNKMTFAKGFYSFLGYDQETLTLESYLQHIHPDDIDLVGRIGAATINHSHKNPNNNKDNVLYISFRIKNAKGLYIKVLSQSSVFETDQKGNMISALVKVSDLSFLEEEKVVRYKFVAENLDQEAFKKEIFGDKTDLFTERELDIIREIDKGSTNLEMAEILGISKHTVATHRKKIMKKSACRSAGELLNFCRSNGVL